MFGKQNNKYIGVLVELQSGGLFAMTLLSKHPVLYGMKYVMCI